MSAADDTAPVFDLPDPQEPGRRVRVHVDAAAATPAPWILIAHGFKGFARWGFFPELARRLSAAGLTALRIDFSGNGVGDDGLNFTDDEGFEKDTISRQLEDLDRVRAWLTSGNCAAASAGPGGFLGHSRGGGLGIVHCAEHADYLAVTLWSAIETFDRFDEDTKAGWRTNGYLPIPNARTGQIHRLGVSLLQDFEDQRERFDILAAAGRIRIPTLVVHGTADPTVPVSAAEQIDAALPDSRLLAVEGAGHTFGAAHPLAGCPPELETVFDATLEHFLRHLR